MVTIRDLNTPFQIKESDLKLDGYETRKQQNDDPTNRTGKGTNEYDRFDHLESDEVVGVINRVLKNLESNKMTDANQLEQLIRDNYREWNKNREDAIKWLTEQLPFEQGFYE